MIPRSLRIKLQHITLFIYDHETEFLDEFFYDSTSTSLLSVSFNTDNIKFVMLMEDGSQCVHSCKIADYNSWFLNFDTEVREEFYNQYKRKIK